MRISRRRGAAVVAGWKTLKPDCLLRIHPPPIIRYPPGRGMDKPMVSLEAQPGRFPAHILANYVLKPAPLLRRRSLPVAWGRLRLRFLPVRPVAHIKLMCQLMMATHGAQLRDRHSRWVPPSSPTRSKSTMRASIAFRFTEREPRFMWMTLNGPHIPAVAPNPPTWRATATCLFRGRARWYRGWRGTRSIISGCGRMVGIARA